MAEHKHGSQDTTEQQKAFDGFLRVAAIVAGVSALILIFLAIVGT